MRSQKVGEHGPARAVGGVAIRLTLAGKHAGDEGCERIGHGRLVEQDDIQVQRF